MPEQLLDGVYDLTCAPGTEPDRIRSFLFESGTLVDAGLPDTGDVLLSEIDAAGVDVERVVVTHCDRDHVGGLDVVADAFDAEVSLPVGSDPDVSGSVDYYYGDGDEIDGFEAVHLPGHRGHQHGLVSPERDVAVLADAVSGSDQRGFPAGRFHLPPAAYSDDLNAAEESLEKLLDFDFDAGLVFHGTSVLEDASEKLADYVYRP